MLCRDGPTAAVLMKCFRLSLVQMRSILASATTIFQRLRSLDTISLKSLGLPGAGSLPSARMRWTTSGSLKCALISELSLATISGGNSCRPDDARPRHYRDSEKPPSAMWPHSGRSAKLSFACHCNCAQLTGPDVFEKRDGRIDEQVNSLGKQFGDGLSTSTERYGLDFDLGSLRKIGGQQMLCRPLANRATLKGHRAGTSRRKIRGRECF